MTELKRTISVTQLAEFAWHLGDINRHFDEATSAQEGTQTQKKYQALRRKFNSDYESEVTYKRTYSYKDFDLTVNGRIDALIIHRNRRLGHSATIEEIKTTRLRVADKRKQHGSIHDAQAKLYGSLVCHKEHIPKCTTKVIYVHPDTMEAETVREEHTSEDLNEFFKQTCELYLDWIKRMLDRVVARDRLAKTQSFPHEKYLDDQHRLASEVFRSLRDKRNLLMSAPTGSGKSMTTLFPAVKSMGEKTLDRTVFVTARTTGQRTAMTTLAELAKQNDELTFANVVAKERICFTEGMPCDPALCEYAKGHFDRVREATTTLLARREIDRQAIETVARTKKVCPFELSLDAAEWADVVVCDYNYVFDPFVALMRLHTADFSNNALLIDEAHRLGERVKEMLNCEIGISTIEAALQRIEFNELRERTYELVRFITDLGNTYVSDSEEAEIRFDCDVFWNLLFAIQESAAKPANRETANDDSLRDFHFAVYQFLDARDRYSEREFFWLIAREKDSFKLMLRCIDPSGWIAERVADYKASVRFSATLSPPALYNAIHGLDGGVVVSESRSLHTKFGVFVVPDVSTYYKHRADTAHEVASMVENLAKVGTGNWLVAFPSFEYLGMIEQLLPHSIDSMSQTREMALDERAKFVDWINEAEQKIALVVMGGVFTESIDYDSDALTGVIVVGPAIPPQSIELEKIRSSSSSGYEFAYRLPAMARVIQAAGRVVRGEADYGIVVLIDPRFTHEDHIRYFPPHWRPEVVRRSDVLNRVEQFYKTVE